MLNALRHYYYERLKRDPLLPQRGWSRIKVSFALDLSPDGQVLQIIDLRQPSAYSKKKEPVGQDMLVPQIVKRTSGVASNFLCDNCQYFLGLAAETKGKKVDPEKNRERFEACKELHHRILDGIEDEFAQAILAYFDTWLDQDGEEVLAECPDVLFGTGNIVFRYRQQYAHNYEPLREAWMGFSSTDCDEIRCIVSGKMGSLARLHPDFKVAGAQSSGASLVSFNGDAFCSYGYSQGENAATSVETSFAYGEALRALLADDQCRYRLDNMTILCWSQDANADYSQLIAQSTGLSSVKKQQAEDKSIAVASSEDEFDLAGFASGKQASEYTERDIQGMVQDLCRGRCVHYMESLLDPQQTFYILGLSPNAARLSVRFFLRDSFGHFIQNVEAHRARLEIVDKQDRIASIWSLVHATVNEKSRDKKGVDIMVGETLRAVLSNGRYPASLLNGVELRICAEREIKAMRAAIIKAYYLKNIHPDVPKEVLTVSLNEETQNCAYVLGRLFATLEKLQKSANPGITATIRDRYFNSASATPALVFPQLISLAQAHLKKVEGGIEVYYSKLLGELIDKLQAPLPNRLSLAERGAFQLGYYHQTQKFYAPSAKKQEQ